MNLNASAVRPNGSFLDKPLARSMSDMTLSSSMSMASSSKDTSALRGYDTRTQIHLPPHRQQEMLDQINSTVAFVLKSMVGDRPSSVYWKPKARKKGISYYVDDNVAPGQYRFCCVSETNAHVEDVMKLFLMTDTDTLLKNYRIVYNNVLDARVLSVISYPTHHTPYKSVYVRYSSFATPALMDNRDMCLVVATDVFTHLDGSTIGYCLWDSVELDECPDYSKTHGLVRSRMFRSGFFMRTTLGADDMPCTKIVYLAGLEAGGIAPRLTTKLVVEKFGANLARVCHHFRRKNLDPTTFVHRSKWASKRDAKYCRGCRHKFSALSTRTNCVACGGVVCKQCFTREKVDVPGAGLTPVHICSACLEVRGIDVSGQSHYSDSPKSVSMRSRDRSESEASRSDTSSIAM